MRRKNKEKQIYCVLLTVSLLSGLTGCSQQAAESVATEAGETVSAYVESNTMVDFTEWENEAVALSAGPPSLGLQLTPVASGVLEKRTENAVIDYSNTKDGYVMVCYTGSTSQPLRAQVKGPTTTYTYHLTAGKWDVFPLSDGNGEYQITVYKNVKDNMYESVAAVTTSVTMTDEFAPYMRSNQYVNFEAAPNAVAKAAELVQGKATTLDKVEAVYDYVINTLTYDYDLAANVKTGYLPDLDQVMAKKTGICFDYASLMTGMLRSQGIPCKLVVGYAGSAYHAWISVWTEENGWVDGAVYFNGTTWERMDPTFVSSSKGDEAKEAQIKAFVGEGNNYSAKYFY
jgi:hypothetical protein